METRAIQVGDQVQAIKDRIFDFPENTLVLWKKGDHLVVQGIVDHEDYREFLIRIDSDNWENVPEPIMQELFISQ